jgi:hypothetical protein
MAEAIGTIAVMTDDATPPGRTPPEPAPRSAPSLPPHPGYPPPQAYPPQAYPPQAYPPQAYPPPQQAYPPPQPYPPQPYPPQPYPPQQAYPPPPAFIGVEQRRSPVAVVAAVAAGLVMISVIAVTGIALATRARTPRPVVAIPAPIPSVATATPTRTPTGTTAGPAQTASGSGGERSVASVALSKGDCIKTLPKGQTITTITLVTCTTPHAAQVGATFSPAGSAYPGSTTYESLIAKECPARLQQVIARDAPPLSWTGYYPELAEWTSGDRSIKCLVIPTDGKPLRRSVVA